MRVKHKEILLSLCDLLKNRRVWAGIVGFLGFLLATMGTVDSLDTETLTEILYNIGAAIAMLIPAILSLWSFLRPSNPK